LSIDLEIPGETKKEIKSRKGSHNFSGSDRFTLGAFVGLPTILHVLFVWVPAVCTILLSFTFWDGIGGLKNIKWVGFTNYRQVFALDANLPVAIRNNILWLAVFALIATPLGILLAYYIDKNLKGTQLYQTSFYLPLVISLAVTGIIWDNVFRTDGVLNSLLGNTNADTAVSWLGDPHKNIWVVLFIASWRHIGYIMLLYLAGMKSVDPSLREASAIDGASEWYTFRRVIIPSLRPVNVIIVVVTIIESLRAFDLVFIINRGTNGLQTLGVLVYQNIQGESTRIGWGSAYATLLFIICLGPIMVYLYQNFSKGND
jgi:multiple sugar transport system permease protein/raffinose/stachyose/melibiose transport system permease protein